MSTIQHELLFWLAGCFACTLAGIGWVSFGPSAIIFDGEVCVTARGRIRVCLLRAIVPFFAGVSRSLGLIKLPVHACVHTVRTDFGIAEVTLIRPVAHDEDLLPVHFNFHGGGFVAGSRKQDDQICQYIAVHAQCAVVNVEYVLAPEYPFPAAILQSYQVIEKMLAESERFRIDPRGLTLGGFSAGGSIVASLVQLSRQNKGFKPRLQVLAYPALNFSWPDGQYPESANHGSALGPGMMDFFRNLYLAKIADRSDPLASPLLDKDFRSLPPTLILVGDRDLIRNDSRHYFECLEAAGVNVQYREFSNCDHGYTHSGPKQSALEALNVITYAIRTCNGSAGSRDTQ